jgi:sugar lactone lactonase YvrE
MASRSRPLGPQSHRSRGLLEGLAWSPDDRTLYFTDSHTHFVWAYDFDAATGESSTRRIFIDFTTEDYIVDGSTVDAEKLLADRSVQREGSRLRPGGKAYPDHRAAPDLPTCCEFGGKDLDTLYVTSALYRRVRATSPASRRPELLPSTDSA